MKGAHGERPDHAAPDALARAARELVADLAGVDERLAAAASRAAELEQAAMQAIRNGDDVAARDALLLHRECVDKQAELEAEAAALRSSIAEFDVMQAETGAVPDAAPSCPFCGIARGTLPAVVVYEDADVIAFLDIGPIRPGHTQIIPRVHYDTFELLPVPLLTKIAALAQQLAIRMKQVYRVNRVAFLFTGGDVPHAHAHVVPMLERNDITSARYIVSTETLSWSSDHLLADRDALLATRELLAFTPERLS